MPAIPGKQKVQPVRGGIADVDGVGCRARWNQTRGQNPLGEHLCGIRSGKDSTFGRSRETGVRGVSVTSSCLFQHFLRDVKIKSLPSFLPPLPRGDLLRGNFHIPGRPGREQAGNGGFDINGRFHPGFRSSIGWQKVVVDHDRAKQNWLRWQQPLWLAEKLKV